MFEHYKQPVISRSAFIKRMTVCVLVSLAILFLTYFIGTLIFHYLGGFTWIDGVLNAVLVMMGVSITGALNNPVLKIFVSFYAVFSGVIFFSVITIILLPIIHRFLHRFHLDREK